MALVYYLTYAVTHISYTAWTLCYPCVHTTCIEPYQRFGKPLYRAVNVSAILAHWTHCHDRIGRTERCDACLWGEAGSCLLSEKLCHHRSVRCYLGNNPICCCLCTSILERAAAATWWLNGLRQVSSNVSRGCDDVPREPQWQKAHQRVYCRWRSNEQAPLYTYWRETQLI